MTVAYTLSVTQSPKATYLNGGFDADARQYRLRSTQHTPNGPRIDAAIAGASPGDFETVWSDVSGDLLRVQRASTGALAQILDWTPHAVFHQATQQLFIGGFRYNYKFIAYSDVRGEWRELHMPGPFGRLGGPTNTVHFYGNICQDESGNVYFSSTDSVAQTWRLAPVAEQWTQVANTPSLSQVGSAIEWFPEANSGSGGLIKTLDFGSTTCRVILLNAAETSWSTLASGVPNGQHALPRHHPSHARVLIVGGTNTQNAATLLEANGTATAVTVVPGNLTMSGGSWCIAHPAGCWLVRTEGVSGRVYAAWPNATYDDLTWQDLGAAPDAALSNPTVAVDTARGAYGTALITAESGLYAWALPAVTAPGTQATASLAIAIQQARSAAVSAGIAIQAPHSATASASAAVQQIQTAQASLQAAVQQAQQATASVSVAAQAAGTESASLQAAIQQARTATSSLNAYLQAGSSMVADIDIAVQQGRAATASASIAARVQQALAADLSLAARQARSAAASLSMSIQGATASTVTAGLNVAVQELLTAAVGVNMALQSMRTASAALSAYLIMRRTVSAAMSTAAQATRSGTAGLSLYVQGAEVVQPLSAPPAKQRLQSSSRGANLQTSRRPLYRGGSR